MVAVLRWERMGEVGWRQSPCTLSVSAKDLDLCPSGGPDLSVSLVRW